MSTKKLSLSERWPLWLRGVIWLCFLGPFFAFSYGFANDFAATKTNVGEIVFAWERHIPFLAWTIVPYWLIDLFYGLAFLTPKNKREVDFLAFRLLTAQCIAVFCFILFPLTISTEKPSTEGLAGVLFGLLGSFDKPFNQAPSLHIALLIILWDMFRQHLPKLWHWPLTVMAITITISVLTTYQHHFIDVPTGALLGWFCVWLWPHRGKSPFTQWHSSRAILAALYGVAAVMFVVLATVTGGIGWWLYWPAVSLGILALCYAALGANALQKDRDGHLSLAVRWLLWPYLVAARINSRCWTWRQPSYRMLIEQISWGRFPDRVLADEFNSVVDMTAEFAKPNTTARWFAFPCLDLTVPSTTALREAAACIEEQQANGKVLVCCALGYSRSAMALAAWLILYDGCSVEGAIARLQKVQPNMVLTSVSRKRLEELR